MLHAGEMKQKGGPGAAGNVVQDDERHGEKPDAVESRKMDVPETPGFLNETQIGSNRVRWSAGNAVRPHWARRLTWIENENLLINSTT